MTRIALLPSLVFALSLVPATARAVTSQEIVKLAQAGVSDEVIIALIDHDRTIFDLTSDQLLALKLDGVSEAVVLAMLRSGPQEPAEAGTSMPDATTAGTYPAPYTAPASYAAPYAVPYVVPYVIPYPVVVGAARLHRRVHEDPASTGVISPMSVAPVPVANTLGPVPARGMFFANPGGAAGMWFTGRPAVPEAGHVQVPR